MSQKKHYTTVYWVCLFYFYYSISEVTWSLPGDKPILIVNLNLILNKVTFLYSYTISFLFLHSWILKWLQFSSHPSCALCLIFFSFHFKKGSTTSGIHNALKRLHQHVSYFLFVYLPVFLLLVTRKSWFLFLFSWTNENFKTKNLKYLDDQ